MVLHKQLKTVLYRIYLKTLGKGGLGMSGSVVEYLSLMHKYTGLNPQHSQDSSNTGDAGEERS